MAHGFYEKSILLDLDIKFSASDLKHVYQIHYSKYAFVH